MKAEDLDVVAEIEKEIFSQPWSKQGFFASLQSEYALYLTARLDGEIVGYCGLMQSFDEGEITNVAVRKSARRHGVAAAMLERLLLEGAQRGITSFLLEVRRSNAAAMALYEKLGFERGGVRKNFYEHPREDAVIMWKR